MLINKDSKSNALHIFMCLIMLTFLSFISGTLSVVIADSLPALSDAKFISALSGIVKKYEKAEITAQSAGSTPYGAKRLLLKSNNTALDPEEYGAVDAIRDRHGLYVLQFDSVNDARNAEEQLKKTDATVYVEPDEIIKAKNVTWTTKDEALWKKSAKAIGADTFGASLKSSSGTVKVAVLDTGISYSAPDLAHRIDTQNGISMLTYYSPNQDNEDDFYYSSGGDHGTHVAGIVAKCTEEVADKAKILPVRVLDNDGSGYASIVASGIRYAAEHGAAVINLSIGGEMSTNETIYEAIKYAISKNCSLVVAAGNEDTSTEYCFPASVNECIVVGAVNDYSIRAEFSNYGSTLDVMAPGVDVYSSYIECSWNGNITTGYAECSGTSMSAPHVAGAAALLKIAFPDAKPLEIEYMLQLSAKDLGAAGKDNYYGYGLVDLNTFAQNSTYYRNQAASYYAEANKESEEASKKAEADKTAADKVISLINAIGNVEYTDSCKSKIDAARAAYDALSDEQKLLVENYNTLVSAEATYSSKKTEADKTAANNVINLIRAIGNVDASDACKARIDTARAAYNALTDTQKGLVTNYITLTSAESTYTALKQNAGVPQTEAPQTEAPQTETPQTEAPQTETPQTETPQTETQKKAAKEKIVISKKPSSVKTKVKKNKVTVSWKKINNTKSGKKLLKKIKSIQVQYSKNKKFKTGVTTKKISKSRTTITLKLKRKTTYYIRVRYVGKGGYSKWSSVKKVKTK